jgi:hypothetical protein
VRAYVTVRLLSMPDSAKTETLTGGEARRVLADIGWRRIADGWRERGGEEERVRVRVRRGMSSAKRTCI